VPAGGKASMQSRLFAGAKEVAVVDGYEETYGIKKFELLIDWGWFYFITKPLFLRDRLFLPPDRQLRRGDPDRHGVHQDFLLPARQQVLRLDGEDEGGAAADAGASATATDDKVKQQQAMMELYKTEKINPISGCLPILIQIPVFFALYKVLFVTIEMRHAPFFGWIKDLSAPDPTTIFNLFGLLPFDPGVPIIGRS
jgi:YidC/Oxa1 family membrane protein insertase